MLLQQFYLKCLAHASYLVADERSKQAVVVDPQRDIEQYMTFAAEHGLSIGHVVLTHLHADFLAGHLELRDRAGARIYLGAKASAEYAFTGLADGDEINLGSVRLRAISTPGHTPESISLLVFDDTKSREIPAVHLHRVSGFETAVFPYTTDVPVLTRWGRPLLIGPGSIHTAHTDHEHVSVDELRQAVTLYEALAMRLLTTGE